MSEVFYQTVGFHFRVVFISNDDSLDTRFQSVSGLDVQLETELLKEGGENQFEHALPTRRKYSDLVLKRGVVPISKNSDFSFWFQDAFEMQESDAQHFINPLDLEIVLLDEISNPLITWKIIHAWPKTWKFGELNAERSEILIETMELHYNRFEIV